MSTDPEITVTNYPPNGSTGELRTILFGGPTEKAALLLEIGVDPDTLDLTLSGGPTHEEIPAFLRDVANMLLVIADESDIEERIDAAASKGGGE